MTLLKDFTKSSNSEYDEYIFPFSTLKYSYISIYLNISSQINFLSISVFEFSKIIPDLINLTYNDIYELNITELINYEGIFLF